MPKKDKWVRRFSVDDTAKHRNSFTIYKITSVLFPIDSPEALTIVSVWKRFNDVQKLHSSMKSLHAGLHLRGVFPTLPKYSYFKRFQKETIEDRMKSIKRLLEFIADHQLLFTSTDFVNFLQTGYPDPEDHSSSVIKEIRSSLHLPVEDTPPIEYQTSDEESRNASQSNTMQGIDELDFISTIPIYESKDIEQPTDPPSVTKADSFESISSLESISSIYDEVKNISITSDKRPAVLPVKSVLPDLINFDAPSTSKFEDYHTMPYVGNTSSEINNSRRESNVSTMLRSDDLSESVSISSISEFRSSSRTSLHSKISMLSLSKIDSKTKTENSYVFEAGYLLNLAARCEDMEDYERAFEYYKSGIEKMLIGVKADSDPQRRALIREKTNKYLTYAENIYKNHLCNVDRITLEDEMNRSIHCPLPISMLERPYEDLASYRVLAVIGDSMMLVLNKLDSACYAMKVIQKIPHNLTEFDEYFLQNTQETRQPILPTNIPYMVPIHAFIQSQNLLFLILYYAPGKRLFDYIKNYVKSLPSTPAREVNLENVFSEPLKQKIENTIQENNSVKIEANKNNNNLNDDTKKSNENNINKDVTNKTNVKENFNSNKETKLSEKNKSIDNKTDSIDDTEISVNDLVINSQKLLLNIDRALTDIPSIEETKKVEKNLESTIKSDIISYSAQVEDKKVEETTKQLLNRVPTTLYLRDALPPSAVCRWGAEIITALESLHNCGVICRDLNPTNILLGDGGHIILTYFITYPTLDVFISKRELQAKSGDVNMYIAPELYENKFVEEEGSEEKLERVCDFWSFGAVMYELLCGVSLSHYHRSVFTSHTILQMPDSLPLEVKSLLLQLLTYLPADRLGAGKDGIAEIKQHPYFKTIDWQEVYDEWTIPVPD